MMRACHRRMTLGLNIIRYEKRLKFGDVIKRKTRNENNKILPI